MYHKVSVPSAHNSSSVPKFMGINASIAADERDQQLKKEEPMADAGGLTRSRNPNCRRERK
jgi:hypothetical protein